MLLLHHQTWKPVKLGSIVSFRTGKLNSNAATPNGPYPFFTCSPTTLTAGSYSFDTECVLMAGNNASGVYTVKYFNGRFDAYQRTYVVCSLDDRVLLNRFLYYVLQTKLEMLKSISTGAATKFLTLAILRDIEVQLPPFPTQRKIATILAAYDDLIENNTRRIDILEEMAQMIYREWFVDFRFPGHENVKMVESELGLIPEGWLVGRIGDLCELRKDSYVDGKHGGLRLVDLARMRARTLSLEETGRPSELTTSRILFQEDDILFGSIRPYLHKVALAPFEGVTNVSVLVIRPYRPHLRALLAVMLGSEDVIRWADQYSTGTKMPVIKWDTLRAMPVALPQTEILLERFQECIGPMLEAIKRVFFRNLNLRCTRDLLMHRLISGEIDVENLDMDTGDAPT